MEICELDKEFEDTHPSPGFLTAIAFYCPSDPIASQGVQYDTLVQNLIRSSKLDYLEFD